MQGRYYRRIPKLTIGRWICGGGAWRVIGNGIVDAPPELGKLPVPGVDKVEVDVDHVLVHRMQSPRLGFQQREHLPVAAKPEEA